MCVCVCVTGCSYSSAELAGYGYWQSACVDSQLIFIRHWSVKSASECTVVYLVGPLRMASLLYLLCNRFLVFFATAVTVTAIFGQEAWIGRGIITETVVAMVAMAFAPCVDKYDNNN